jgi:hypothetical protein
VIKALKELGKEGTYLNPIKAAWENPLANIILTGEQLNYFL